MHETTELAPDIVSKMWGALGCPRLPWRPRLKPGPTRGLGWIVFGLQLAAAPEDDENGDEGKSGHNGAWGLNLARILTR
jgi:hypothetical protein